MAVDRKCDLCGEIKIIEGIVPGRICEDCKRRESFERSPIDRQEPPKRLTIAIDYDDTFTTDKATWSAVCHMLSYWHRVVCVSARANKIEHREELRRHLPPCVDVIVLSYDQPKREAARKAGIHVDIWIDDRPEGIATKEECLAIVG